LAEAAPSTTPTAATTPEIAATIPDPGDGVSAASPLRRLLEETATTEGLPMKALTVLAVQNDPFRVDTPAGHRDGRWLADVVAELLGDRRIHLRGLHYAITMHTSPITKPNGERYVNDDKTSGTSTTTRTGSGFRTARPRMPAGLATSRSTRSPTNGTPPR